MKLKLMLSLSEDGVGVELGNNSYSSSQMPKNKSKISSIQIFQAKWDVWAVF